MHKTISQIDRKSDYQTRECQIERQNSVMIDERHLPSRRQNFYHGSAEATSRRLRVSLHEKHDFLLTDQLLQPRKTNKIP